MYKRQEPWWDDECKEAQRHLASAKGHRATRAAKARFRHLRMTKRAQHRQEVHRALTRIEQFEKGAVWEQVAMEKTLGLRRRAPIPLHVRHLTKYFGTVFKKEGAPECLIPPPAAAPAQVHGTQLPTTAASGPQDHCDHGAKEGGQGQGWGTGPLGGADAAAEATVGAGHGAGCGASAASMQAGVGAVAALASADPPEPPPPCGHAAPQAPPVQPPGGSEAPGPPTKLPAFTRNDVWLALRRVQARKAGGADGVPSAVIAALRAHDEVVDLIHELYLLFLEHAYWPQAWNDLLIAPILKQAKPPLQAASYRPIHLIAVLAKVFASVVEQRLQQWVPRSPEQMGFSAKHGTRDNVLVAAAIFEAYKEAGLHVAFVDFKGAFDSVDRSKLKAKLAGMPIPDEVQRLIASMYSGVRAKVQGGGSGLRRLWG